MITIVVLCKFDSGFQTHKIPVKWRCGTYMAGTTHITGSDLVQCLWYDTSNRYIHFFPPVKIPSQIRSFHILSSQQVTYLPPGDIFHNLLLSLQCRLLASVQVSITFRQEHWNEVYPRPHLLALKFSRYMYCRESVHLPNPV